MLSGFTKRSKVPAKDMTLGLPFSEDECTHYYCKDQTNGHQDDCWVTLSLLSLAEFSLVTLQTLAASDFALCDAIAVAIAELEIA